MVKAATMNTKKRSSAGQANVPPTHLKYPKYDTSSTTEGLRRTVTNYYSAVFVPVFHFRLPQRAETQHDDG